MSFGSDGLTLLMAASLRLLSSLRLLPVLLLLMSLLARAVPDRTGLGLGLGRGRSAEYYQRRYTGRPRRGPLPTARPSSAPYPGEPATPGHDDTERDASLSDALQLDRNVSTYRNSSVLSDTVDGETEVSALYQSQLTDKQVNSTTHASTDNTRDMRPSPAATAGNSSTKTNISISVTRNQQGNNHEARQEGPIIKPESTDPVKSATLTIGLGTTVSNSVDGAGTGAETERFRGSPQHKFVRKLILCWVVYI